MSTGSTTSRRPTGARLSRTLPALVGALIMAAAAWAGPDEVASSADKLVRSAERAMFNGKKDDADAQLKEALALLRQLEAEAPDHAKLPGIRSKYEKVRKDLDRRLGGGSGTPAPPAEPPAPAAEKPAPGPAPAAASGSSRDYRLPLAEKAVASVAKDAGKLVPDVESIFAVDPTLLATPPTAAQLRDQAGKRIERVVASIARTESQYGEVLGLPNADLEAARQAVTAAQERANALAAEWSARESERAAQASSAAASKEAAAASAQADVDRILELHGKVQPSMEGIHGASVISATTWDTDVVRAALATIQRAEEAVLPELGPELARMAKAYGTEPMEINNALFRELGRSPSGDPGGKLADLLKVPDLLRRTRAATGVAVAEHVDLLTSTWTGQISDAQMERLNQAREMAGVAVQIDPDSEKLRELNAGMDRQIEEYADRMKTAIDAATWPGHVGGFAGPGSVGDLAKSAMEWFRQDRDWGGRTDRRIEILDVCVRGPWQVANRDVFGRVIRWRLPILVAVTNESLRPRNVARVYELSIVGLEGAPGAAAKAPPWDGVWVGDNYMMRLDRF